MTDKLSPRTLNRKRKIAYVLDKENDIESNEYITNNDNDACFCLSWINYCCKWPKFCYWIIIFIIIIFALYLLYIFDVIDQTYIDNLFNL